VKPPQINLQQIVSFYFVGKEKSFSQQIKALETQFKVKLINVKRKRVHLTKAGERLLDYAEEIVNHVTMAENFLKGFSVTNLQLGVACTLMLYLTPIIDRFKELHPSVRLAVREGPSLMLVKDLLDFKFDVCLVGTLKEIDKRLLMAQRSSKRKLSMKGHRFVASYWIIRNHSAVF
jgi:DNA-binding transcriptional LysR family regulator